MRQAQAVGERLEQAGGDQDGAEQQERGGNRRHAA